MKVHTTMFDAAYGHSNGGAISITTRGGGNELHGTAYDFKRWAALNANSWSNHSVSWGNPGVNMSNHATFGVISSGGGGRSIQMSARVIF